MTFVRTHARAGEIVYHDHARRGVGWAQWGGLPGPQRSWDDAAFGLPGERLYAREALLARLPADPEPYLAQGVVWFAGEGDANPIKRVADRWIREGMARETYFGPLRVVELFRP